MRRLLSFSPCAARTKQFEAHRRKQGADVVCLRQAAFEEQRRSATVIVVQHLRGKNQAVQGAPEKARRRRSLPTSSRFRGATMKCDGYCRAEYKKPRGQIDNSCSLVHQSSAVFYVRERRMRSFPSRRYTRRAVRHPKSGCASRKLVGQSLSALCASSLKNVSAVGSSHSLSEAMLLLSLTLFRLIRSEHFGAPP